MAKKPRPRCLKCGNVLSRDDKRCIVCQPLTSVEQVIDDEFKKQISKFTKTSFRDIFGGK